LRQHREVRDDLARREQEASDRLAEAELRHTVGEYDSSKWSEIRAEILEELVKLREELKVEQAEIGQLEEVLDAIDSSGGEEEGAREAEVVVESAESGGTAGADNAPGEEVAPELELQDRPGEEPPQPEGQTADELAFLRSVISGDRSASNLKAGKKRETGTGQEPPAQPQVARPSKGTVKKTVKCTDCGTLNLPTEWYCENCGAELTAL
jgi:hypothetical protein